jgi:hypothetical protein
MDSLPTGSMQSWLIVAAAALSPIITVFLADTIDRVLIRAREKGGLNSPGKGRSGIGQ